MQIIKHELLEKIPSIRWFHHFDEATFNFNTSGEKGVPNAEELELWKLDSKWFENRTVLDIGAWDGYYSFYAEKQKAKRVLAIDDPSWYGKSWGNKDGFNLVCELLNSKVQSQNINLYDINTDNVGLFDTVLMLGVLYHLTSPLDGLKNASAVTTDLLIVETTIETSYTQEDPIFIYKPTSLVKDDTSHYSLNKQRVLELFLDICSFRRVEINQWCEERALIYAWK